MLEFDSNIQSFEQYPVCIQYLDEVGALGEYTPDFLINYRTDCPPGSWMSPRLCTVIYRSDIKRDWKNLKFKFKSALKFASQNGMNFKIFTEKEIQTEYLDNVKFLNSYRDVQIEPGYIERLEELLNYIPVTTPEEIIRLAARDVYKQAQYLFVLWHMVAIGLVRIELIHRVNMKSPIWSSALNDPVFVRPSKLIMP